MNQKCEQNQNVERQVCFAFGMKQCLGHLANADVKCNWFFAWVDQGYDWTQNTASC
jgi:hypothetical protein